MIFCKYLFIFIMIFSVLTLKVKTPFNKQKIKLKIFLGSFLNSWITEVHENVTLQLWKLERNTILSDVVEIMQTSRIPSGSISKTTIYIGHYTWLCGRACILLTSFASCSAVLASISGRSFSWLRQFIKIFQNWYLSHN